MPYAIAKNIEYIMEIGEDEITNNIYRIKKLPIKILIDNLSTKIKSKILRVQIYETKKTKLNI